MEQTIVNEVQDGEYPNDDVYGNMVNASLNVVMKIELP